MEEYEPERALNLFKTKEYDALVGYTLPFAIAGDPAAQSMMGHLSQFGTGVDRNGIQALEWYQKAADQGFALAWNNLGTLYTAGAEGVPVDHAKATRCYEQARALGFPSPKS